MRSRGRVFKFGHNVDTDVITAGKYLYLDLKEIAKHTLEVLDADFAKNVRPGDIVVAGRNFGCGSSREHAPRALKHLGVSCIVAESFARIFQRNAVAIGLPVLQAPGLWDTAVGGDDLEIDLAAGLIVDHTRGARLEVRPLPARMLDVLTDGGIVPALKRLAEQEKLRTGEPT